MPTKKKSLGVILILLFTNAAFVVYSVSPNRVLGKILFHVYIYANQPDYGSIYLQNITFAIAKLGLSFNNGTTETRIQPETLNEISKPLLLQLNVTLASGNTVFHMPIQNVSFVEQGEYYVLVSYIFEGVPSGSYALTLNYTSDIRTRNVDWTGMQSSLMIP